MNFKLNYKKAEEFIVVLFIILSGFMTTAIFKINNFFTFPSLDEMLWHARSNVFWDKMLSLDFSGLIQSAQPGITVYWFTGFMVKFINFDFSDVSRRIAEKEALGMNFNDVMNINDQVVYSLYQPISFAFNTPLFLLLAFFYISFYYLLRKLGFNKIIAFFSLLFLTTNIFITYWTTPSDKMLYIFMTLSFLTFLVYISKRDKTKKYLFASAILGAWAVLSKLTALFLLPFFVLVSIFYLWPLNKNKIKIIIKDCFYWTIIFIFICVIFLPSIITSPEEVSKLIFGTKTIEQNHSVNNYVSSLPEYFETLIPAICGSPGMPLSFLAYFILRSKKKYREKYKNIFNAFPKKLLQTIIAYLTLFIIMVVLLSENRDARFMFPSFVMMNIIAATGLYGVIEIIKKKIKLPDFIYFAVILALIFSQLLAMTLQGELMEIIIEKLKLTL